MAMTTVIKLSGPNDAQASERMRADIRIYQGDDEAWTVDVFETDDETPADLAGYTAKAQIRRDAADRAASVVAEMSAVIDGSTVILALSHDVTEAIKCGAYVWDMQLVSETGVVQTVLAGRASVTNQVTV